MIISDRLIQAVSGDSNRGSVFSNGFTYSGHPVACAAGIANMEVFESQGLLENALEVGPYMQEQLRTLSDLPIVGDIRGMGLMGCLECVASQESRQPLELDYEVGSRIDKHCQALGLLVRPLINMCVMSPPLCITRGQIDEMVSILREGISRTMADLEAEGIAEFH